MSSTAAGSPTGSTRTPEVRVRPATLDDAEAIERIYSTATDKANELHVKWAKPYIRWVLPDEAPKDLDLGPADPPRP